MNIEYNYNINSVNCQQKPLGVYRRGSLNFGLKCDIVSFSGKKTNKKEEKRIEGILKNIDGLHDPYSEIIMMPKNKYQMLVRKINHQHQASLTSELLSKYTHHMFKSDRKMLSILSKHSKDTYFDEEGNVIPTDYHTILKYLEPAARNRLKNSQYTVVDSMRYISKDELPEKSQKEVESYLRIIEKDIHYDRFRIKKSRELIEKLYDEIPEKEVVDKLLKESLDFPNTATDTNAFIVKNADKTHAEIAELLISPGLISIEHIKPSSQKGKNDGGNYMAASRRMNNLRRSMPMDQFIEMFPKIPRYTQCYMNDLIEKVNRGEIEPVAYLLGDVKTSLYEESKGKINVDITGVRPDILNKVVALKNQIAGLVVHFNDRNNK